MTTPRTTVRAEARGTKTGINDGPRPHRLTVQDVMTREVISVTPSVSFHDMIELMHQHAISALPVLSEGGMLLGVVSEADLLLKQDPPPAKHRWAPESERSATRRRKSAGATAAEVMSTPVITVAQLASLVAAIRLLEKHRIKRLLVIDDAARLIGVVSRRDLLAGFTRTDDEIRADIVHGVIPRWVLVDPANVSVDVKGGVVTLAGTVDRRTDADVFAPLVRGLDGVVDVHSTVGYRWDDRDPGVAHERHVN